MAAKEKNGYLFISYSHKDSDLIAPLIRKLKDCPLPLWYDSDLQLGRNFDEVISRMILNCGIFVLLLSDRSVESDYVGDEFAFARNNHKRIILCHLHPDIKVPEWMQLRSGRMHQLLAYDYSAEETVSRIEKAYREDLLEPSEPISAGLRNHFSDLMKHCRDEFAHISSQMGVRDIERSIDPGFFCPITPADQNDHRLVRLLEEVEKNDHTHILLQADGGLGKTYQFLYAMYYLLGCDRPCAYIPCHLFTKSEENKGGGYILDMLSRTYFPGMKRTAAELNEYFRAQSDRTFVLFLDGFNEAVAKTELADELHQLGSLFSNIKIVVSSRSFNPVFAGYSAFVMTGLNEDTVRAVLRENGKNYDALDHNLRKLLLTPMFLRLYIRTGTTEKEIDTAAELMDQERKRVLNNVRLGMSGDRSRETELCLNRVFPDFVRREYCSSNRRMSFFRKQLEDYLKESFQAEGCAERMFRFLAEYSIIMKSDDRTHRYAYRHEHYRDYWVACSVFRALADCLEQYSGAERTRGVIRVLNQPYSDIVLQYIGELAQVHLDDNMLLQVLDCLRRTQTGDDLLWEGKEAAEATARLIEILKLGRKNDLVGMDLSELNLSETQLNQARTCSRNRKARFGGSLITEETFIVSMHESAPRRVEILCLDGKHFLVTVSNHDLLISTLPGLETVWRYPHTDSEGKPVSTQVLTTSVMLDNFMAAVDSDRNAWAWEFSMRDGIPSVSAIQRIEEGRGALKVFPWSDEEGPLIGLQCESGKVLQLAVIADDEPESGHLENVGEYHLHQLGGNGAGSVRNSRKTMTSSPDHSCLYWAVAGEGGIHVWKYHPEEQEESEICLIPDTGLIPDYMICVGTEQASRKNAGLDFGASGRDGSVLILSALCKAFTRVYQIRLPRTGAGKAAYRALSWPDRRSDLDNVYKLTERQYNRINASSFSGDKMVLAASDGSVYQFTWQADGQCYTPDRIRPKAPITSTTFAVEDVLYASPDTIAAVSVDRSVHLLDANSLTLIKLLKGYNDGLRHLAVEKDSLVMATSYDGCVLELAGNGNRFVCKDKIPVGDWVWSLEKISPSVYAAGYRTGLALIDKSTDAVLSRRTGYPYKVEHLLYLPDCGSTLLAADKKGVRVIEVREDPVSGMSLEETGRLCLPDTCACYWLSRKGDTLYASVSEGKDERPRIACFFLARPLSGQEPSFIETGVPYGRIRDIHFLRRWLAASGPCAEAGKGNTSRVCLISTGESREVKTLDGFDSYIAHSAVHAVDESVWRLAVIDDQTSGKLYQFILKEGGDGSLSAEPVSVRVFPTRLNEVAFDSRGDLLLAGMNGVLYYKPWESDEPRTAFRNKCFMLTFGADMSALRDPVNADSRLGTVLADFGNRLEKSKRRSGRV